MGFFSGRASFARYRVLGPPPGMFGPEHLEKLHERRAGRQRLASADGIEVGWSAGDHILDTRFDLEKNIIADMLHFALRIDKDKLPSDLLKAYYQVELEALAAGNHSGRPSTKQKREARELAQEKLEEESKDGRFKKRKLIPVVWDGLTNEILFGTTSTSEIDRLFSLFEQTFEVGFEAVTAGRLAHRLSEIREQTRNVDDASPSAFVPGVSPSDVAWVLDEHSRDYIGNEFLLWLWFTIDTEEDTLDLEDGSECAVMLARTLTLECPRAQTGHETISSDGPSQLPEAKRAIQTGKLPRKVGLTLARHGQQYELTLHAETLAVGAAKFMAPEETEQRALLEARAGQIRDLIETLDLLYDAFCKVRFSANWSKELPKLQQWLRQVDRPPLASAG